MSQFTDYAENQIADYLRGQGLTLPASWWLAGLTAASDASVTESIGLDRFELARSLANWSGTQGDATTLALLAIGVVVGTVATYVLTIIRSNL